MPDGTEHWIKSGYDPDGHRVRVQSSDGHLHHIEGDEVGDVRRVELEGRRWQVDFERDALGLEVSRSFPVGVASRWVRDTAGRPTRRTIPRAARLLGEATRFRWNTAGLLSAVELPDGPIAVFIWVRVGVNALRASALWVLFVVIAVCISPFALAIHLAEPARRREPKRSVGKTF